MGNKLKYPDSSKPITEAAALTFNRNRISFRTDLIFTLTVIVGDKSSRKEIKVKINFIVFMLMSLMKVQKQQQVTKLNYNLPLYCFFLCFFVIRIAFVLR